MSVVARAVEFLKHALTGVDSHRERPHCQLALASIQLECPPIHLTHSPNTFVVLTYVVLSEFRCTLNAARLVTKD